MAVIIDHLKCNGCRDALESRCEEVCPGNLMIRNEEHKAVIRSMSDCWDCMACVKACPMQAIKTKLPYELAAFGAELKPKTTNKQIVWTLKYPDGREEVFTIPVESI